MEIRGLETINIEKTVVVLGAFDGLHRGHMSLIEAGYTLAKKKGARLAVMTFDEHPDTVLKASSMKLLTTQSEKLDILKNLGVEIVFMPHFRDIASFSGPKFFNEILIKKFGAVGLVVGPNFRFGKKARGTSQLLEFLGKQQNVPVVVNEAVKYKGRIISSTMIRRLLQKGKIEEANTLLGRRYFLSGSVTTGEGRGRKLKMPTANLLISPEKLMTPCGVYLVEGSWDNKTCYGLLSISDKPTFHEVSDIVVEVYFLDLDENLYQKDLKIELIRFQRGIVKYNSASELMNQVAVDIQEARDYIQNYLVKR